MIPEQKNSKARTTNPDCHNNPRKHLTHFKHHPATRKASRRRYITHCSSLPYVLDSVTRIDAGINHRRGFVFTASPRSILPPVVCWVLIMHAGLCPGCASDEEIRRLQAGAGSSGNSSREIKRGRMGFVVEAGDFIVGVGGRKGFWLEDSVSYVWACCWKVFGSITLMCE